MKAHRKIYYRLFPPGTWRRMIVDLGYAGGRVMLQKGPRGFYWKYKEFQATKGGLHGERWLHAHTLDPEDLETRRKESEQFSYRPKISIILPVWNTREGWLRNAINSVLAQCYQNWELCIVDDASTDPRIHNILSGYQKKERRIRVIYLTMNEGVASASNHAIAQAEGDYFSFLDHDDAFTPDALYEVVKLLNESPGTDFIYSDEVLVNKNGVPVFACYKPDFSLDYLLSHPYIVHLVAIRGSLVREAGGFRKEFAISQDYDLFLRIVNKTRNISHIPKILYYWRQHPSSAGHKYMDMVSFLSRKAIREFLIHEKVDGEVFDTGKFNFFRVKRTIKGNPRISIIIPTRDRTDLLHQCIESIFSRSIYGNFEIIIVDNLSSEKKTKDYLENLKGMHSNIRVMEFHEEFNFSKLNNTAASLAKGEHLLFLNNDVEVISPEWIEALLEHSQRDDIACVGAKLLYPDNTIQHVGVIIGLCGPAEHVYKFYDADDIGYMGHFTSIRNYSGVTGACMMIQKKKFHEIGGFDENFMVGFGDIDLCLRACDRGYRNVFTPFAELYHWESLTRGKSWKEDRHPRDTALFCNRWRDIIRKGDPYYNPNLPLDSLDIRPYVLIG